MNDHRKQKETVLSNTPGICAEFVELYCRNEMVDFQSHKICRLVHMHSDTYV